MNIVLDASLSAFVPLRIRELQAWTPEARVAAARHAADAVAAHGDDLQYGGKHCAATWAALVDGLAAAAYQPGGVTFAGRHWCVDHGECERAAAEAALAADNSPRAGQPGRRGS